MTDEKEPRPMTDPLQSGSTPQPAAGSAAPSNPASSNLTPSSGEPPLPVVEPAEPGTSAPAQAVAREGTGEARPRSSRVRWAIALVGVALVVGVTAAIVALAAGRPTPSIALGYMPEDAVQYMEYRLDLPGDQRQKLASFLSAFPGFDDQAAIDTKLDETFDRILASASNDEQTWTADIEPWFGGQVAIGSGVPEVPDGGPSVGMMGGSSMLVALTVKDRELAADWFESSGDTQMTRGEYNGAILFSSTETTFGPTYAVAINDEVMLIGMEAAVKAAVDSNGDRQLANDPEFKAAFGVADQDYVLFVFLDYKTLLAASMELTENGADTESVQVVTELMSLIPAWIGTAGRFENDAIAFDTAQPSGDLVADAGNASSALLGFAPPETIAYAEVHDVGAAVTSLLDRLRQVAKVDESLDEIEATIGQDAGDIFGWWGDAAVAVSDEGGIIGGGLLIQPTDAAAAERILEVLRSAVVFGGGGAGVEVRDVEHGAATITVVDFTEALGPGAEDLPAGYEAEIAWAATPDVVVVGYGQAFVESVLDAGPGPSLADDGRVRGLLDRVGDENLSFTFLDVRAAIELVEPLVREDMSPEEWTFYETEIKPFLLPFDAMAASLRKDGDTDRGSSVITVTKP